MSQTLINIKAHAADTTTDPQLKQLEKLWQQIEKHEKRNDKLAEKIQQTYQHFEAQVLPVESQYCQQVAKHMQHLIAFIPRKSFTHVQREELFDWIQEDIQYLETNPFADPNTAQALRQAVTEGISAFNKNVPIKKNEENISGLKAMLDEMFDGQLQLSDEELEALLDDPSKLEQHIEALHQKIEEEEEASFWQQHDDKDEDDSIPFGDDFQSSDQATKQAEAKFDNLFRSSQLNKMYKRLAALIHPDKEQDPTKKREKHALMQQLASAKKQKDAFSLLKMYHQYVPDNDLRFDKHSLHAIEQLLNQKITGLNLTYQAIKHGHDIPTIVWRKFFERNKKITQQNFDSYRQNLKHDMADIEHLIDSNRTVKKLAIHLSQRIKDKKSQFPFHLMDDFDFDNVDDFDFNAPF